MYLLVTVKTWKVAVPTAINKQEILSLKKQQHKHHITLPFWITDTPYISYNFSDVLASLGFQKS